MIITESFLRHNTPGHTGAVSPTKAQGEILGITYPLTSGWLDQIIGKTLTRSQAVHFKSLNVTKRAAKQQKRKIYYANRT